MRNKSCYLLVLLRVISQIMPVVVMENTSDTAHYQIILLSSWKNLQVAICACLLCYQIEPSDIPTLLSYS